MLLLLFSAFLFNDVIWIGLKGHSMGRRLFGLRVVRAGDGSPIGILRAVGRLLFADLVSTIFMVGYIWALIDDRKRTLHDVVLDTLVVHEKSSTFV